MSLYKPYTSRSVRNPTQEPVTEFDILKASHKFLRGESEASGPIQSWNDQLAKKYYDSLYREFALCNLKHYKSGNFALRWRTENEVLDGTGETTCANMRCEYHRVFSSSSQHRLTTLELPFAYEEHDERREALVKVVLCPRCVKKLMWKRAQEKRMLGNGDALERKEDGVRVSVRNDSGDGEGSSGEVCNEREDDLGNRKRHRSSRPRSPSCSRFGSGRMEKEIEGSNCSHRKRHRRRREEHGLDQR